MLLYCLNLRKIDCFINHLSKYIVKIEKLIFLLSINKTYYFMLHIISTFEIMIKYYTSLYLIYPSEISLASSVKTTTLTTITPLG